MYNQKDAFLLGRNNTIDIKLMHAKEYIESVEWKKRFQKWLTMVWVIGYIVSVVIAWAILYPQETNASSFLARFPTENTVIACYNNWDIRESKSCTSPWDQNIILPARSQIEVWQKYYTDEQILNRLSLVNFESSFNENAWNKYAVWYVQTLRTYSIPSDIDSQLNWMKNHKEWYTRKICSRYWNEYNSYDSQSAWEYGVLACIYRMHYHAYKWVAYAKKWILVTKYYKWYMFWIK